MSRDKPSQLAEPATNKLVMPKSVGLSSLLSELSDCAQDGASRDLLSTAASSAELPEFWQRFREHGGRLEWAPVPLDGRLIAWTTWLRDFRQRVGVIGSRLGRRPDLARHFSIGLREFTGQLDSRSDVALVAKSSPQYRLVRRAIQRSQVDMVTIDDEGGASWQKWKTLLARGQDGFDATAILSPLVSVKPSRPGQNDKQRKPPTALADRLIVALSDSLFAPNVRARGLSCELLEERAASGFPVCCWPDTNSGAARFVTSMRDAGVDIHRVDERMIISAPPNGTRLQSRRQADDESIIRRLLNKPILVHCTRAPSGPWPLETERQYLDAILATCEPRDAFASLKRILDRRLLARSRFGLRGGHEAVCLSASPLNWINNARVYRPHRMRWDFEPYGLCLSRQTLFSLGARPVLYAQDDGWEQLPSERQLFFQVASTDDGAIDWRAEQEWRLPSDVSLSDLTLGDYIAFTKSEEEADELRRTSPCPVAPLATLVEWCDPA